MHIYIWNNRNANTYMYIYRKKLELASCHFSVSCMEMTFSKKMRNNGCLGKNDSVFKLQSGYWYQPRMNLMAVKMHRGYLIFQIALKYNFLLNNCV